MFDIDKHATLIPVWDKHRQRFLTYGYALRALLPESDPPVSIRGRELRPDDEGVGIQFQYTIEDTLYNQKHVTACYVVQISLVQRKTSIAVQVDDVQVLEHPDGHHRIFERSTTTLPLADQAAQRRYFAESLTRRAALFFTSIAAGDPIDTGADAFSEVSPEPTGSKR